VLEPASGLLLARNSVQSLVRELVESGVAYVPAMAQTPRGSGKLTKIDNMHLKTLSDPTLAPPPDTFSRRPTPGLSPYPDLTARIGNDASDPASAVAPPNPSLQFQYPLSGNASYTFGKIVQFSPRGEGVIDNSNYMSKAVSEIGVEPTHGAVVPASVPANVVAIQFTGLGGSVKIYRQ